MLRGWLLFHKLESIVIMYSISIMLHKTWKQICTTFTIFACFWYTKLRLMQKSNTENAIIESVISVVGKKLSIEEFVSYPIKRHFVYTVQEVLVPMISLILERGGKQIHVKRIDSMFYVWSMLRSRRWILFLLKVLNRDGGY